MLSTRHEVSRLHDNENAWNDASILLFCRDTLRMRKGRCCVCGIAMNASSIASRIFSNLLVGVSSAAMINP